MGIKYTNFATSTLSAGIAPGATALTVFTGDGGKFPTLGIGDYFYAVLENLAGTREIIKVTARAGDSFTTIVRAQDGTSALTWNAGDKVELRLVAIEANDSAQYSILSASTGASLLGYQSAETGTIASTVASTLAGMALNAVKDFGADNTGVSDTSSILQTAINASISSGRPLFIPAGTYNCGSTGLTINNTTTIFGEGRTKTILQRTANVTTELINITGNYVKLYDFSCQYTPLTTTADNRIVGIVATSVTGTLLSNLHIYGRFYLGIHISNGAQSIVENCLVVASVNRCFYISASSFMDDILITNCIANGAETGSTPFTSYGFNTNCYGTGTGVRVRFTGCIARNFTSQGFALSDRLDYSGCENCVANNINAGYGFLAQLANTFANYRAIFSGCTANGCVQGFYVSASNNVTITGCNASSCTDNGIYLVDAKNCVVTGNVVDTNTTAGIKLDATGAATTTVNTIVGNTGNLNGTGIITTANTDRSCLVGNTMIGNTSAQMTIAGTNNVNANNLIV